jgi:hypothetical protein
VIIAGVLFCTYTIDISFCTYDNSERGKRKEGMGRRPLSDVVKTGELVIRLTATERAELDRAAGGAATSTWARELLLKAARTKKR